MKNIGWLLFIAMSGYAIWQLSLSTAALPSSEEWIEAEATVIETRNKLRRKATRSYAQVSYRTKDGQAIKTEIEVLAIPFFGTTLAPNDTLSILYDPEKPMLAKSPSTSYIESYGLYFLIGAGIVFSIFNLKKVRLKTLDA